MIFLKFRVGPFVNAAIKGTSLRTDTGSICSGPKRWHRRAAILLEGEASNGDPRFRASPGRRDVLARSVRVIRVPKFHGLLQMVPVSPVQQQSLVEILQIELALGAFQCFIFLAFKPALEAPYHPRKSEASRIVNDTSKRISASWSGTQSVRSQSPRVGGAANGPPAGTSKCEYNPTILNLKALRTLLDVGRYDALEFAF